MAKPACESDFQLILVIFSHSESGRQHQPGLLRCQGPQLTGEVLLVTGAGQPAEFQREDTWQELSDLLTII